MRLDARELADAADGHGVGGGGVRHAGPGHPGVELSLKQSRKGSFIIIISRLED